MPKVLSSNSRRVRAHHHPAVHTQAAPASHAHILLSAPRKVSFEDGHQSSTSFTGNNSCSTSSSSISSSLGNNNPSCKSSLRRKAPSVCLVGLAQDEQQEETRNNCLSPTPIETTSPSTAPSSPWGHFVDILVPLDEDEPCHKRRHVGDTSPLFLEHENSSSPTFGLSLLPSSSSSAKHPKRRRRFEDHPYGLKPRRRRGTTSAAAAAPKPSFLPNFFLDGDRMTESSETQEVEQALQQLQV